MVITEDMAKKIRATTPEMLRFALRGRGLAPEEIEQSCTRLMDLKGAVEAAVTGTSLDDVKNARKAKKLCVMKAEHLKQIHLKDLPGTGYALFDNVKAQLHTRMKEARAAGYRFEPGALEREGVKKPELAEVSTTERRYAAGGIADSLSDMDRMLKNEVTAFEVDKLSKFLRSSGKWRDMISAVKEASKAANVIRKQIGKDREALDRNDPRVRAELEKADRAIEKARKATDAYLQRKMNEKHLNDPSQLSAHAKHDYERKRMEHALRIRDTIREYDKLRNPDLEKDQSAQAAREQLDFANKRRELQAQQPDAQPVQALR